jgi:aminodeoxyfutalosine deaminase
MEKVRIYTARYLLPVSSAPVEDGALLVQDGRIAAVGRRASVCRLALHAPRTDFGDAILLPPLVNAHTHLELTSFPDWAMAAGETLRPSSFVEWILEVVRIKRSLPLDAFTGSLAEGIRRSLRAGTGAVGDILSYFPARKAYAHCPLHGRAFLEVLGRSAERWDPLLASVERVLAQAPSGSIGFGLSPHSPYTLAEDYLRQAFDLARRRQLPATIHLAESADETAFLASSAGPLAERFYPLVGWGELLPATAGLSPVRYLQACGGLHPGVMLVHGVHVDAGDIALMAGHGTPVVLCPRSNARLGVGRAPLAGYLAAGVLLALGTDSMASNDSLSIWDELAFARQWFGDAVTPQQLLTMATLGGARALGLAGEIGSLQAGWGGHFQVLAPSRLPPAAELWDYLCGGCGDDVHQLYLNGREVLPIGD